MSMREPTRAILESSAVASRRLRALGHFLCELLQLFHVVTVTDVRAGVSSEIYRVRGIEETYDTTKDPLVYGQRVGLAGR